MYENFLYKMSNNEEGNQIDKCRLILLYDRISSRYTYFLL